MPPLLTALAALTEERGTPRPTATGRNLFACGCDQIVVTCHGCHVIVLPELARSVWGSDAHITWPGGFPLQRKVAALKFFFFRAIHDHLYRPTGALYIEQDSSPGCRLIF